MELTIHRADECIPKHMYNHRKNSWNPNVGFQRQIQPHPSSPRNNVEKRKGLWSTLFLVDCLIFFYTFNIVLGGKGGRKW